MIGHFILEFIKSLGDNQVFKAWRILRFLGIKKRKLLYSTLPPERMDYNLLGACIRNYGHIIDRATTEIWSEEKQREIDEHTITERQLLDEWKQRNYNIGDDISWAEETLRKYETWKFTKKQMIQFDAIKRSDINSDEFLRLLKTRRSVRYFSDREVEKEKIMTILDAGRWAPCSSNRQTWKFIVEKQFVESESSQRDMTPNKQVLRRANVRIYVAMDERFFSESKAVALDAGAIMENMLLMTHAMGLGGCWMYQGDSVNQAKLCKRLGIEHYFYVYSVLLIGYPEEFPNPPLRKSLEYNTKFIGWDE